MLSNVYNLVILISTAWLDRRDDATVNRMTENIISRIEAVAKELKVADRYLYINYASAAQADKVFAGYGEKSPAETERYPEICRSSRYFYLKAHVMQLLTSEDMTYMR